jgi:hypothetical protein
MLGKGMDAADSFLCTLCICRRPFQLAVLGVYCAGKPKLGTTGNETLVTVETQTIEVNQTQTTSNPAMVASEMRR